MQTPNPYLQQPEFFRILDSPCGHAYQRIREFGGWKKRTSAAKAGYGSLICGTAEAVPFQEIHFSRLLLKPGCEKSRLRVDGGG
jgi:hypothetical protein